MKRASSKNNRARHTVKHKTKKLKIDEDSDVSKKSSSKSRE